MDKYARTYLPWTKTSHNSEVRFNVLTTLNLYCKQNLNIIPSDKNSSIKQIQLVFDRNPLKQLKNLVENELKLNVQLYKNVEQQMKLDPAVYCTVHHKPYILTHKTTYLVMAHKEFALWKS